MNARVLPQALRQLGSRKALQLLCEARLAEGLSGQFPELAAERVRLHASWPL
jgi:hypothetical protein